MPFTQTFIISLTTAAVKRGADIAMKVIHCFSNHQTFLNKKSDNHLDYRFAEIVIYTTRTLHKA